MHAHLFGRESKGIKLFHCMLHRQLHTTVGCKSPIRAQSNACSGAVNHVTRQLHVCSSSPIEQLLASLAGILSVCGPIGGLIRKLTITGMSTTCSEEGDAGEQN